MAKKSPETVDEKKYFVLFETDEEGIRQFQSCSVQDRSGAMLSKMCIEGKMVPPSNWKSIKTPMMFSNENNGCRSIITE